MRIKKEIIFLNQRHLKVANEFADNREKNVGLYQRRGGFKRSDIVVGALGEMGVYKYLKSQGLKLDKPDFTIYESGRKSYNADLIINTGEKVHVKSQSVESAQAYGHSYLLQRSDPILREPDRDYLAPCLVHLDSLKIEIYGTIPVYSIIEKNLLGECAVEFLRRTKVAIYLEELKKLKSQLRWKLICDKMV